ncbi:MAG: ribokinase [Bacteroidota bacterium]
MGRVLVIGSANTDMVVRVPRLPAPGETILGGTFRQMPGGKGANQAVAAARLGAEVTLMACVGADALGEATVERWQAIGINTAYVARSRTAATGVALITVDAHGENSIAVASGANQELRPGHLVRQAFAEADVVLLQLEVPMATISAAVEMAHAEGCCVVLNPAPARAVPASLLQHIHILTPNEHEFRQMSGATTPLEAAAWREHTGVTHLVVTQGAKGAAWYADEGLHHIAAHHVTAIDTTGAGDVFNGALAASYARGLPIATALANASAAAAFAVTQSGAQPEELGPTAVASLIDDEQ